MSLSNHVFVAIFISAWQSSRFSQTNINSGEIDSILIEHRGDTLFPSSRKLSNEKVKHFTHDWNKASSIGPCKYLPKYHLKVYHKDGTIRGFRANGKTIKEKDDYGFQMKDENYFEKLWESTK